VIVGYYILTLKICAMKMSPMFFQNTESKCFLLDVLYRDLWFILRYNLRSKHIFENINVIMSNKEDNQGHENVV
jgi:hypothetical protein